MAVGASIVIPLVTRSVVDGPIAEGDRSGLIPLGLLALALGVLEAGLVFIRRWVQSYAALGMETAVRDDLYAHLQRLPVAFHDKWQTGQLLSRATTDLSTIRRFLSFGLVYLVINIATFITVVALLVHIYPPLAILVAASSVPLLFISRNLSRAYLKVSRHVQDLQGDLATFVEESAVGVRVIRSFGRRDHVGREFRRGARTLHDSAVGKATLVARFWSLFDLVPEPHARRGAAVRLGRGVQGRDEPRRPGRLRVADADARLADRLARLDPGQRPGGDDRGGPHLRGVRHRALDRRQPWCGRGGNDGDGSARSHAHGVRRRQRRVAFEDVSFTYAGATEPVLRDIDLEITPGRDARDRRA